MKPIPIPPGAERTLAAALFSYTAQRPMHVANVLDAQAAADDAEKFHERAKLYRAAAALLRGPGYTYTLWQRIKLIGGAFAATWRAAVAEVDLEVEEREKRARESHGARRGRVELGAPFVFGVLIVAVLALCFAGTADILTAQWVGGGMIAILGIGLVVDRVSAVLRMRRAVRELAEIDRAFEETPAATETPSRIEISVWRSNTSELSDRLLTFSEFSSEERVRVALQRRHKSVVDPRAEVWRDAAAWRVTSSGAFEREEA